ncbi:MAG: sortase [Oscillospiraceae bacterium]|nr:sortase [Oscillospiraceae bacterium]
MTERIRRTLIIVGVLLLLAALGLTIYNIALDKIAGRQSAAVLQELMQEIDNKETVTVRSAADLAKLEQEKSYPAKKQPDDEADKGPDIPEDYFGVIQMPTLELSLPVQPDWDYERLRVSPCRMQGSPEKQNLVILAHNYDSHFGRLKTLSAGDEITLYTMDGLRYVYRVDSVVTIAPQDIELVTGGDCPLTLFTCTPGGRTRVVVYCRLADD